MAPSDFRLFSFESADGSVAMPDAKTDGELLREFVYSESDQAFAEAVQRHVHWIYAMVRRRVRDPHLADDITQSVFIVLARKARSLVDMPSIAGWLFKTSQYATADALRRQMRRRKHEEASVMYSPKLTSEVPIADAELAVALDEAIAHLRAKDRKAILLRFFQGLSHAQIGEALGTSEDAARARVLRAVSKLRNRLAETNPTLSVEMITGVLSIPIAAAPITINSPGGVSASAAAVANRTLRLLRLAKIKLATTLIAIPLVVAGSAVTVSHALAQQNTKLATPSVRGKSVPDDSSAKNVIGEYYMGGNIKRVGVYSLTGRRITVRQAIVSAGMFDKPLNRSASVEIISRLPNNEESFVIIDLVQLMDPKSGLDRILAPSDIVQILIKDAPEGPIAAGDLISLTIGDLAGLHAGTSFEKRVDNAGNISLPLAGPCHVAGQSFADAENAIQKVLFDANLIEQTLVSMRRLESAAKASITPGPIQLNDRLRVRYWDLAGGGEEHQTTVRVDKDRNIDLPAIGKVGVGKLSEAEAEKAIADSAKQAKFSEKPLVNVQRLGAPRAADEL